MTKTLPGGLSSYENTAMGVLGTPLHPRALLPELELQIMAPSPYTKRAPAPPKALLLASPFGAAPPALVQELPAELERHQTGSCLVFWSWQSLPGLAKCWILETWGWRLMPGQVAGYQGSNQTATHKGCT